MNTTTSPNTSASAPAAVHAIDHYALAVPDLDVAQHFFSNFGLRVERTGSELALRAADSDHVWARILQGSSKHLAYLTLNCSEAEYAPLAARIAAHAAPAQPHPQARYRDGTWFHDPDGNLLQVRVGPKTVAPTPRAGSARDSEVRGVEGGRSKARRVAPRRLSHILLFTADVLAQVRFYEEVLGLRLSDRSEDLVAFMHAPSGSDHHLMAFSKSGGRGFHHASWDVAGAEEVGLGWMQMQEAGYTEAWGPGRHVLGSNYFCYVRDPWGSFCEYSGDIDYIHADQQWNAGNHAPHDSLYLWGPPPIPTMLTNTELADAPAGG